MQLTFDEEVGKISFNHEAWKWGYNTKICFYNVQINTRSNLSQWIYFGSKPYTPLNIETKFHSFKKAKENISVSNKENQQHIWKSDTTNNHLYPERQLKSFPHSCIWSEKLCKHYIVLYNFCLRQSAWHTKIFTFSNSQQQMEMISN